MARTEVHLRVDPVDRPSGKESIDAAAAPSASADAVRVITEVLTARGGSIEAVAHGVRAVFDDPPTAFEACVLAQRAVQRSEFASCVEVGGAIDLSEGAATDATAVVELANGDQILVTSAVVTACPLADVRGLGPVELPGAGALPLWLSTDSRAHTSGRPLRAAPGHGDEPSG